jgi:hypothetical protein
MVHVISYQHGYAIIAYKNEEFWDRISQISRYIQYNPIIRTVDGLSRALQIPPLVKVTTTMNKFLCYSTIFSLHVAALYKVARTRYVESLSSLVIITVTRWCIYGVMISVPVSSAGRSWDRSPIWSNERLLNWYVLLLRYARSNKEKEQILVGLESG